MKTFICKFALFLTQKSMNVNLTRVLIVAPAQIKSPGLNAHVLLDTLEQFVEIVCVNVSKLFG